MSNTEHTEWMDSEIKRLEQELSSARELFVDLAKNADDRHWARIVSERDRALSRLNIAYAALAKIAAHQVPTERYDGDNHGDTFKDGADHGQGWCGEDAREALAKIKEGT